MTEVFILETLQDAKHGSFMHVEMNSTFPGSWQHNLKQVVRNGLMDLWI